MHVRPDRSSGRVVKNGEPAASGCTAEQTSCKKPGRVSSAERAPPPIVAFASQTRTEHPARASVIAAARPFGPEPTTTASYANGMVMHYQPFRETRQRLLYRRLQTGVHCNR